MQRLGSWSQCLQVHVLVRVLMTLVLLTGSVLPRARASMTVLVGEPFGNFGTMMPVGHTAIYLDHVCADVPLKLRACRVGEPEGVVVARYHRIGNIDWIATPVLEFLYAVERPEQIHGAEHDRIAGGGSVS